MILEVIEGLYYLSHAQGVDGAIEVASLRKKQKFLTGVEFTWQWAYCDYFERNQSFPSFELFFAEQPVLDFLTSLGIGPDTMSMFSVDHLAKYRENWVSCINRNEIEYLQSQLQVTENVDEKRKINDRITGLLAKSTDVGAVPIDIKNLSLADAVAQSTTDGIVWPLDRLNSTCGPLRPGQIAFVLGGPASGKSTMALNMTFVNSHRRPKNTLYFYLEDTPIRYKMNLVSRYSYDGSDRLQSQALKRGLDEGDEAARATVARVDKDFNDTQKGRILFQSMSGFSNDPMVFGPQLSKFLAHHQIDFLVVDHLLRFGSFRHRDYSRFEYLNLMCSCLANIALGIYGDPPISVLGLVQPNREGEERGIKTKGAYTIYDISDISNVEKDAYIIVGVYSNQEMRNRSAMNTIIIKNRDGSGDVDPQECFFDAPFSLIQDSADSTFVEAMQEKRPEDLRMMDALLGDMKL